MKYEINGNIYDPIKVGNPGDWDEGNDEAICDDCGAKYGEEHLSGCDVERCPLCCGQLISCGHKVYEIHDEVAEQTSERIEFEAE